ncbi:tyrosine-type recombinase/integrase [Candidatus Margulisiibacteriota bacterium]
MAALRKRKGIYAIAYRIDGKQFTKTLGKIKLATAKQLLREFEEQLSKKKLGIHDPKKVLITDFKEEYLLWVKNNQTKSTYNIKELALRYFINFLASQKGIQLKYFYLYEITPIHIEKFKAKRLDDGVTKRTINIQLDAISNLIRKAKEWDYVVPDIKICRFKENKRLPRFFSKEEIKVLLKNTSKHLEQILLISLHTGIRSGELLSLQWKNIDFVNNKIYIKNEGDFNTKNKSDRAIPMNSALAKYLSDLKEIFIEPTCDKVVLSHS